MCLKKCNILTLLMLIWIALGNFGTGLGVGYSVHYQGFVFAEES